MMKKWLKRAAVIVVTISSIGLLFGCQPKEEEGFQGSGHSKDGTVYNITVEAEDVWTVGVESDNGSMGIQNADNVAYDLGEIVIFSELDYEDGEAIIWTVADEEGNIVETPYNYVADGNEHNLIVNEEHHVVEK